MGSNGGVNPADPFLVRHDELPELTSDQCIALAEIAKTGGRLTDGALSRETLEDLLRLRAVTPARPGCRATPGMGMLASSIVTMNACAAAGHRPAQHLPFMAIFVSLPSTTIVAGIPRMLLEVAGWGVAIRRRCWMAWSGGGCLPVGLGAIAPGVGMRRGLRRLDDTRLVASPPRHGWSRAVGSVSALSPR